MADIADLVKRLRKPCHRCTKVLGAAGCSNCVERRVAADLIESYGPDVERQAWCREHIHYFEAEDAHGTGTMCWTDTNPAQSFEAAVDSYMAPPEQESE